MSKVFITADIHGNPFAADYLIERLPQCTKDDFLIVCGDFGAQYGSRESKEMKQIFAEDFPGTLIILRGNHDNRYWEDNTEIIETYNSYVEYPKEGWNFTSNSDITPQFLYEEKYPNIWYTKDSGDILSIGEYQFLFVPGAYSIDKDIRKINNWPWNPKEQLNEYEQNALLNYLEYYLNFDFSKIDFVISHTAPYSLEPTIQHFFIEGIDQSKVDKSTEKFLDKIEKILDNNYIHWFFGHYHHNYICDDKHTMLFDDIIEIGDYVEK